MDSLAEGIDIATVPQARRKLETHVATNQDSIANNADNIGKLRILKYHHHNLITVTRRESAY